MSERMEISAHETGLVRVFAVDLPDGKIESFAAPGDGGWPLREALGARTLDPDRVEVFPAKNLEGLGLTGYLTEGLGVDPQELNGVRGRLDAVDGPIAIVTSAAFQREAQTLAPQAPLRHLGTFREAGAPVRFDPLPAGGASGEASGTPETPAPEPSFPRLPLYLMAGAILLALVVAILLGLGGGDV